MRSLLIILIVLGCCATCRPKEDITLVPDQKGGFVELAVDGKTIDDANSPLCPKGVNKLKLSCFAIQQADTTIAGFHGIYRRLWIDLYAEGSNDIGQLDFELNNFYPGEKKLQKYVNPRWGNLTSWIDYWDWDIPVGAYAFDETQPYFFIINSYDEVGKYIEGSFDIGYVRRNFKIPMRSDSQTIRIKGRFKAKIRLMKEGEFID